MARGALILIALTVGLTVLFAQTWFKTMASFELRLSELQMADVGWRSTIAVVEDAMPATPLASRRSSVRTRASTHSRATWKVPLL